MKTLSFRKTEGERLPHGCESVYCSLAQLLSNWDNYLQQDQICFHVNLWTSLSSYRYLLISLAAFSIGIVFVNCVTLYWIMISSQAVELCYCDSCDSHVM